MLGDKGRVDDIWGREGLEGRGHSLIIITLYTHITLTYFTGTFCEKDHWDYHSLIVIAHTHTTLTFITGTLCE